MLSSREPTIGTAGNELGHVLGLTHENGERNLMHGTTLPGATLFEPLLGVDYNWLRRYAAQ